MRHLKTPFVLASFMAAAFFLAAPADAATLVPGDLVKLADDGNPLTTADSAVYFHGSDGKRYVFPNSQTYFTWYADFSLVKIVTGQEMAALPIGGNITYRPGTRLVKITSDPNVYAVEPGGKLRWIQSEAVAKGLYGDQWNKRVDDVPDAFFFNYAIGDPLAAAVYPDGTIVKRSSDNVYFRIENRNKRKIVSTDVRTALRVQDAFVIVATSDLSDYPNGADIATAESTVTDTSQKALTAIPSVPTLAIRLPATNFVAVGGDSVLLELRLSSVKAFAVKKLTVKIEATTNNPASSSLDDDKGGLIYQNNAQPNLKQIRFLDAAGVEVFGRKEVIVDVALDQSQTFTYSGTYDVPASVEKTLYLKTQLNTLLPTGEGYKVTVPLSGIEIVDPSTGLATPFQPQADLVGPTLSTLNASLEVSTSATPGLKSHVRGTLNAEIAGLSFKATTVAPNVIKSVTFQGYVDEENMAGFLPGTDTDNGSPRQVKDLVSSLNLYTSTGTKVAGPVQVGADGRVSFSGLSYSIPAGQTATLVLRGDISPTVDLEVQPDRLAFDIVDAGQDMIVVDDKGGPVVAVGKLPNGGTTASTYATIKKNGTVAFSWAPGGGNVIAGREILLGTLSADVKIDSYTLKTVSFRATGSHTALGDLRLEYPVGTSTATANGSFLGDVATFSNLSVSMPVDKITALKLYGKVLSRDAGATYGQQLKVKFGSADSLQFISVSNGDVIDESKLTGPDYTVPSNPDSTAAVRFSGLSISKSTDSPTGTIYRDSSSEGLRFLLKTEAEGGVRIKKLTFKVVPADVGQAGADSDALERWADVNGDFMDDDAVVDLRQVLSNGTKVLIGEDGQTRLMYSIVRSGNKDATPADLDSTGGDYGLFEYEFNEGSELNIGAGASLLYSFAVDTTRFSVNNDYALGVELLGGADLLWTDIPSGSYTALTDSTGTASNTVTVKK